MIFNPKVSIVIPVFNGAQYLREAIDSALAQTYRNIEVLVINDGSSDRGATERVASSYGRSIRYVSQENGGVASALNRAVHEITGEYFSWLSHDDLYVPDKVEKEISVLSEMACDQVVTYSDYSVFTTDPDDGVPVSLAGTPSKHFRYWITVENKLHGCTLLIPRAAFQKVGGFKESLRTTQDYDLWFRLAKEYPFVHISKSLVRARNHPCQGSHKMICTASAECDTLLSNFIRELTPEEIVSATGKSLEESYVEIAFSMFTRGFYQAGDLAEQFAKQIGARTERNWALGSRNRKLLGGLVHRVKSRTPSRVKRMIKAALCAVKKQSPTKLAESHDQLKEKFVEMYEQNTFGGRISRSGKGSDLVQTEAIRRELPKLIRELSVRTFLDAPCGDWYWMRKVSLGVEQYIGVDIVETLIEKHKRRFGNSSHSFLHRNLVEDELPRVDLIFCRDCLVHLRFEDIRKVLLNFKRSNSTYLLTTTFTSRARNSDLVERDDYWRTLNLHLYPFNFPEPLRLINEHCTEENGQYKDKCLGLWRLQDITVRESPETELWHSQ